MEESFGWAADVRRALTIPVVASLHGPHWLHRVRPGKLAPGPDARRESWRPQACTGSTASPRRRALDRTQSEWACRRCRQLSSAIRSALAPSTHPRADLAVPHLLFIGRFDRIKGADILFEAFAVIAAAHPTCRPDLHRPWTTVSSVRTGPLHHLDAALSALLLRHSRPDRSPRSSHPRRDQRTPPTLPDTLITSRYEDLGVALIEAMAAGSAVVSTRVGGCAEILRHGETGLLVPSEDPAALSDACSMLLNDPLDKLGKPPARTPGPLQPRRCARGCNLLALPAATGPRTSRGSDADLAQTVAKAAVDHRRQQVLHHAMRASNLSAVNRAGARLEDCRVTLGRIPGCRIVVQCNRHPRLAVRMLHRLGIAMPGVRPGVEAAHPVEQRHKPRDLGRHVVVPHSNGLAVFLFPVLVQVDEDVAAARGSAWCPWWLKPA